MGIEAKRSLSKERAAQGGAVESQDRSLEYAFVDIVQEKIFEAMSEALEEVGFSAQEEIAFRKELGELPREEVSGILSLPHELRHARFAKLHERFIKGASMAEIVHSLAQEAREHKYTLGYHMSNADISPKRVQGHEVWTIDGREQDHRDADLPMAYYSTDLANLYDKKRARFLYIVRADRGPGTTHKQDNNGSWGRATKLDVVEKLTYEEVMRAARERSKEARLAEAV